MSAAMDPLELDVVSHVRELKQRGFTILPQHFGPAALRAARAAFHREVAPDYATWAAAGAPPHTVHFAVSVH
jgi:hypothetical protein